jgi:hypothetical protein
MLQPALLDGVPLAGLEQGLNLIEADRGGGPATVSMPGKPAPLAHAAKPISVHSRPGRP